MPATRKETKRGVTYSFPVATDPIPAQPRPKVTVGPDNQARGGYTVRLRWGAIDDPNARSRPIYGGSKRTCNDRAQLTQNILDALAEHEEPTDGE